MEHMEYADFVDMANNLVYGIVDRLNDEQLEALVVDTESRIQAPKYFMSYLVSTLARDRVPISPSERDTVLRLMRDEKIDLTKAEKFNVAVDYQPPIIKTNPSEPLDHATFTKLATNLVHGFHGRIDQAREYMLRQEINDNIPDPRSFVDTLIGPLILGELLITPTERNTVIRLMQDQKVNLTPIIKFRILNENC